MEGDACAPPPCPGFRSLDQAVFARIISALFSTAAKEHGARPPETALLSLRLVSRGFRDGVDQVLPSFCCYVSSQNGTRRFNGRDILIADFLRQSLPRWPSLANVTLDIGWQTDHLNATLDSLVAGCPQLRELTLNLGGNGLYGHPPATFQSLRSLSALEALTLTSLQGWSQELCHIPALRRLRVAGSIGRRAELRLVDVPVLEELEIDAEYLVDPTDEMESEMSRLDMSTLQASTKLRSVKLHRVYVPRLKFPPTLEHLTLRDVESISHRTALQLDTQSLPMLRSLHIHDVELDPSVPLVLGGSTNLTHLEIDNISLQGLQELVHLRILKVSYRDAHKVVGEIALLPGLETLELQDSRSFDNIHFPALPSLTHLKLRDLHGAFRLPSIDMMPSLRVLSIQLCMSLEMIRCVNVVPSLTTLRIRDAFPVAIVDAPLSLVLFAATGLRELELPWTSGEDLALPLAGLTRLETLAIMPEGAGFTLPSLCSLTRLKKCTIHTAPNLRLLNLESLLEPQGPLLSLALADLPKVAVPDFRGARVCELLLHKMARPHEPIEGLCSLRRLAVSKPVSEPYDLVVIGCPALEEVMGSFKHLAYRGCPRLTSVSPSISIDMETIGFKW